MLLHGSANRAIVQLRIGGTRKAEPYCLPRFSHKGRKRSGLYLYHILEPSTWFKLIARVNGANTGALYVEETGNVSGYNKISKPPGHTWKSFCNLLLMSMPKTTRDHYIARFRTWMKGWRGRGYQEIPDEAPKVLEDQHWAPSYRRLCKVLLRNDWWCKGLGLIQPKSPAWDRFKQKQKNGELGNVDA